MLMFIVDDAVGQSTILGFKTLSAKPEYIAATTSKVGDHKVTYASLLGGMVTDVVISNDSLFQIKASGVRSFVGKIVAPGVNVVVSAGVALSGKGTKTDPFVISALNAPSVPTTPTVPSTGTVDLSAVYARMDAMQGQINAYKASLDSVARIQTAIPVGLGMSTKGNVLQLDPNAFGTNILKVPTK